MAEYDLRHLSGCTPKSAIERFHASYIPEPNSGCWLWLGAETGSNNYGRIKSDGKPTQAHRFAYQNLVGDIPPDMLVLHRCDNSACVNPSHLFIGTGRDNSDDKVKKNRQAKGARLASAQGEKPKGEDNHLSKLTEEQVLAIFESKESLRKTAKTYNVSGTAIFHIKTGRTWAWLTSKK
jgi:hypothetical protein